MFRSASIKLGLDYAVMHNIGNNVNQSKFGIEGVSSDKTEHMSGLSKRELENLLKHGAYDMFREEKEGISAENSNRFCEESIDQILQNSSILIHGEKESSVVKKTASSSFAKASFVSSAGSADDVAIDDPDFWTKVVGLSVDDGNKESANTKRKCRMYIKTYKEGVISNKSADDDTSGYNSSGSEKETNETNVSNENSENNEPRKKRKKSEMDKELVTKPDFSTSNLSILTTALVSRGYFNWESILKDTKFKWSVSDIIIGCNKCLLQLLFLSSLKTNITSEKDDTNEVNTDNFVPVVIGNAFENNNDIQYIDNFLKKSKLCRLILQIESSNQESSKLNTNKADFIDLFFKMQSNQLTKEEYNRSSLGIDIIFEKFLQMVSDNNTENFNASKMLNILKSMELPIDMYVSESDRIPKLKSNARSKLSQIEDLFELFLIKSFIKGSDEIISSQELDNKEGSVEESISHRKKVENLLFSTIPPQDPWKVEYDVILIDAVCEVTIC